MCSGYVLLPSFDIADKCTMHFSPDVRTSLDEFGGESTSLIMAPPCGNKMWLFCDVPKGFSVWFRSHKL